jgi:hypothetical protein
MEAATDHTIFIATLAAVTAIVAAFIAAGSADMRQRRQLKHDRRMTDLAELRSLLDEAILAFQETIHQAQDVFAQFTSIPGVTEEEDEETKATRERIDQEGFSKHIASLGDDRDRMLVAGARIAIRLGDDSPLYQTYQSAVTLVIKVIREAYAEARRRIAPQDLNDGLVALRKTFVSEAGALVGSRLPES